MAARYIRSDSRLPPQQAVFQQDREFEDIGSHTGYAALDDRAKLRALARSPVESVRDLLATIKTDTVVGLREIQPLMRSNLPRPTQFRLP